ncbi:hypothetical protein QFC24_004636 [Naganishia onofrii]|uniref:Uncharacterized protein n=1 Tax=Naganishia onofrii TaxID=1851511 RepID=A0ACC2XBA4_9TREE|nr:hypothetical protein QFC24_004636 [Naganishia onofrii]
MPLDLPGSHPIQPPSKMSTQIPTTMKALVQHETEKRAEVKDHPVPKLDKNEVLVKIAYVSQNPTDWKHSAFLSPPNVIIGCDYSGTIVKLGDDLKNNDWKVGDHVAGVVHGGKFEDKGSFAEAENQPSGARVQSLPSRGRRMPLESLSFGFAEAAVVRPRCARAKRESVSTEAVGRESVSLPPRGRRMPPEPLAFGCTEASGRVSVSYEAAVGRPSVVAFIERSETSSPDSPSAA